MSAHGDMMREILGDYHERIGTSYSDHAVYIKAMYKNNPRALCFIVKPFGSYRRIGKEYLVFRSYDGKLWEFHELPF